MIKEMDAFTKKVLKIPKEEFLRMRSTCICFGYSTSIDIRKHYADVLSTKKQDEQNHKVEEE